jgi:diadenylate cyclase
LLTYLAEEISAGFDQWDDRYAKGPSLYFLVVSEVRIDAFADPLGSNRWPVETARILPEEFTAAVEAASEVAFDRDGAVVVAADGTVQEQMVRVRSAPDETTARATYADWMSAKHLSALEVSTRTEVLAAVTLSEEDGRVTVFDDGQYENRRRDELGGRWPAADPAPSIGADHQPAGER